MITSSKTRRAPCRVAISRAASRYPGSGATSPMLAATGSRTNAATCPGNRRKASSSAFASLYGTTVVSAATSSGLRGSPDPEGRDAGPGRDEERVGVPVVPAVRLHDPRAARGRAREPHGAHGGLRARVDEPDHLDRRHHLRDALGEPDLALGRSAEGGSAPGGAGERPYDYVGACPRGADVDSVVITPRRRAPEPARRGRSRRRRALPHRPKDLTGEETPPGINESARR